LKSCQNWMCPWSPLCCFHLVPKNSFLCTKFFFFRLPYFIILCTKSVSLPYNLAITVISDKNNKRNNLKCGSKGANPNSLKYTNQSSLKWTNQKIVEKGLASKEVRRKLITRKQSEIWILKFQTFSQFLRISQFTYESFI